MDMELKVILIDLRQYNYRQLKECCSTYGLDFNVLSELKRNKISNLWIDLVSNQVIACGFKRTDEISINGITDMLLEMKPLQPPRKQRTLDLDSILDKINKFGTKSLKDDELDFLKKY